MNIRKIYFLFFLLLTCTVVFANPYISKYASQIQEEQARIDLIDGTADQRIMLKSNIQSEQATNIYINDVDEVVNRIMNSGIEDQSKVNQLKCVLDVLLTVNEQNIHFYNRYGNIFSMILKVQSTREDPKLMAILKSNVFSALNLIPFYADRSVAEKFFTSAAHSQPAELLKHFDEIDRKKYKDEILTSVVSQAPMKVKNYLYSNNLVHKRVRESKSDIVVKFYRISREQNSATRAFILLNDINSNKISINRATEITSQDSSMFRYLIEMRSTENLIGEHSVDEALKYQCLKKVRLVNELHNASDAVRFSSVNRLSAHNMYTLMVYSEDEIFTSTFLGMYNRMMNKMTEESSYQFLHELNFNKFRTFIKMCAGYNVLSDFLSKMTSFEKQMLFKKMVEGLENTNDNLESAVAIADTYGSMSKIENRMLLEESIIRYYEKIRYSNEEAEKLYGLIINILNMGEGLVAKSSKYNDELSNLTVLSSSKIFVDGKNIQQHFFFDDPDGHSSYNSFVAMFYNANWNVVDKGTYVIIKSASGKKVEIYANKATREYAGQSAIKQYFTETKRWPDVVVHRGHSYFANAAIESLTPNAEIVFLGSCGGYNNINEVLNYSPDAQIISSKQIGTMTVNNRLCYELNELIRKGNDIVWEDLWKKLDKAFPNGTTADDRFQDYIPPHKNLGALLIKTYRSMI